MNFIRVLKEFGEKENAFVLKAERDYAVVPQLTADKKSFSYYVRIFLDIDPNLNTTSIYKYNDISLVTYELADDYPDRTRISRNSKNNFEIKIWTTGYFNIQVTVYPKFGASYVFNGRLQFFVSEEEKRKNAELKLGTQNPLER